MGMESLNVYIWWVGLIQRRETPPEIRGMFICSPPPHPPWDRALIEIFFISFVKSIYPESQDYFLLKCVKLKKIN